MKTKQRTHSGLIRAVTFGISGVFSIMTPAYADDAEAAKAIEESEVYKIEATTLTGEAEASLVDVQPTAAATRIPMTARETPQSVSLVNRERMEAESLFSLDDVLRGVTGVNVAFYDTQRPLYYARGFLINDFQVDGLPSYSSAINQEYDTGLYDRVEVLRGANGLLTGTGNPSATVNLTRKRPEREFGASVTGTVGKWDFYRGELDVNVPLTEDGRVRSRFVVVKQDRESYYDRYSEEKFAFLGAVAADLTDTTELTLGYQFQNNEPKGAVWGTVPHFTSDGAPMDLPVSFNFAPEWTRWSREAGTIYTQLEQGIGDTWSLKANYSHTEGDTFSRRVYGYGAAGPAFPDPNTGAGAVIRANISESEEVQDHLDLYLGGEFTLFDRQHDLVIGANASKTERRSYSYTNPGIIYVIPNIFDYNGNIPVPAYSKTGAYRDSITEQSGAYGSVRFKVLDPLAVIGGARISQWETKTKNYDSTGTYTGTSGAYKVSNEITPYFGFVYDINQNFSIYGSYTEIFQPQNNKDKNNSLLDPVVGSSMEGGIKGEFLDGRLRASFAVYENQQDNLGVLDSSVPPNSLPDGSSAYTAVNGTENRGFEFEVTGYVTEDWSILFGYTRNVTERQETDLLYANFPENSFHLSTHYRLPGNLDGLSIGGGVSWQSEIVGENIPHPISGTTTVKQDAYALFNLFASYEFNEHLTARASITNLTNEEYFANIDYPNFGEPRSFSISLKWEY